MAQTTLISFFQYTGFKNKWKALGRMGRPPITIEKFEGLSFFKPLGTGSGNGFSIKPDFSTYGFVCVFDTKDQAEKFTKSSEIQQYKKEATSHSLIFMKTVKSHGEWSKQNPFMSSTNLDKTI